MPVELLAGVRPDTKNVVWEETGMGMAREATQGANGKYAVRGRLLKHTRLILDLCSGKRKSRREL